MGVRNLSYIVRFYFFSEDMELWSLMFCDFVFRCVQWLDATTRQCCMYVFVLLQKNAIVNVLKLNTSYYTDIFVINLLTYQSYLLTQQLASVVIRRIYLLWTIQYTHTSHRLIYLSGTYFLVYLGVVVSYLVLYVLIQLYNQIAI